MSGITTHVLDASVGRPGAGMHVRLEGPDGTVLGEGHTDADGRIREFGPDRLRTGTHRLVFATGAYFDARGQATFYPEVTLTFDVADPDEHYHVPLLLSPYAYSTYRGS
ncbi:MAG TPA: hydroxyisourate hydrolase [Jatrophihabitans sp.]|nr:hydroxyisourate hydrolase [Jatrophihabitans sp.]